MGEVEFSYVGFLANVDESILELGGIAGCSIRKLTFSAAAKLAGTLFGVLGVGAFGEMASLNILAGADKKEVYVASLTLKKDGAQSPEGFYNELPPAVNELQTKASEVDKELRKVRLFSEGNIRVPSWAIIGPGGLITGVGSPPNVSAPFRLQSGDGPGLAAFLKSVPAQYPQDYVNLAWDNYELSFETNHLDLQFIVSITGLEALFNMGRSEVTYRVCRGTAIAVGQSVKERQSLFLEMKDLYDLRSELLHQGTRGLATLEKVNRARNLLRRSILWVGPKNVNKKTLGEELTQSGF